MVECFLDAEEVEGSIPSAPTIFVGEGIQEEKNTRARVVWPSLLNTYKIHG